MFKKVLFFLSVDIGDYKSKDFLPLSDVVGCYEVFPVLLDY